jgi:hypothetical protein
MSKKCCRSNPRCAGCPVRARAAARTHRELTEAAVLVTEILAGRAGRPLPAGVAAALQQLELAPPRNGKRRAPAGDATRR